MTPDVTVIIPAYNSMPYVTKAVGSALGQSLGRERIEIITIDDGSTDGTGEELDRLAQAHPELTVIHQENSGGPSSPRNTGLDRATGRYVFMLDADDFLGEEALERMVQCADEQGTDIVLGKMVGIGGRRPPKSMFSATMLSTDVFESRAWWTMSIMKLFRRELIERLGLRFPPGLIYEDQPFTGAAYLAATGISILADYDYVHISWRDDGANMTRSHLAPERLTGVIGLMLALIVSRVEQGAHRDHLLKRHFEMEFLDAFVSMAESDDVPAVREAFTQLREWALAYYPYESVQELSPAHRICHSLLRQGKLELLLDFMRHFLSDPSWDVHVDGDRVFAVYPLLGDTDASVPAECFDVTSRVRLRHQFTDISWTEGTLQLEGLAYLELLDSANTATELILRLRDSDVEYTLPVTRVETPGYSAEVWRKAFVHDHAGISASIDPLVAADGAPLPPGIWDVRLKLSSKGVSRDTRIGKHRGPEIDSELHWRVLPTDAPQGIVVASYFTVGYDNLSLDVGAVAHPITSWLRTGAIAWSPTDKGVLEVTGMPDIIGLGPNTVSFVLADEAGREFEAPVTQTDDGFVARIAPQRAANGRPLSPGTWSVRLRARVGESESDRAPRAQTQLASIRIWRLLLPHRVRISKPGKPLAIAVQRVELVAALVRRLRGPRSG